MIFIQKRKVTVLIVFIITAIFSITFFHFRTAPVFSEKPKKRIVLDAGHGFPDGGAIGMNGTIESTINLKIAKKVQKILEKHGYTVIMTRTGEDSLADSGNTISRKKHNDMHKRLSIINNSDADIFVSIHMNKYTDSRYRGAQVLYSGNFVQSEKLAQAIQNELHLLKDNLSKRSHLKAPSGIFLLKNANIPAVIVECGFLSNFQEEQLLISEKYQTALAEAISRGIDNYYKKEASLQ